MNTTEKTPEQIEAYNVRACKQIDDMLPPGCTFGYIGNVWTGRGENNDDRSWYIFLPHPNRIGTSADRIGGYSTNERYKLARDAFAMRTGYNLSENV